MSFAATMSVVVAWGDCDPADIVFYPNYFRWFDAAAWNLFEVAAGGWERIRACHGPVNMPLLGAECRFTAPSRRGDALLIESRVVAWEGKVFRVEHRVLNAGTLAAEGIETRCWAVPHPEDPGRLKGAPLPADILALFRDPAG